MPGQGQRPEMNHRVDVDSDDTLRQTPTQCRCRALGFSKLLEVIAIRQALVRRRSLAALVALALTCLALVVAHSGPGVAHMDEMGHQGGPAKAVMGLCLAVAAAAITLLGAWSGWVARPARRAQARVATPSRITCGWPLAGEARPRAGPANLQVFLR